MSLYEVPGLTGQQEYDRDNLAADLGLARDDPALAQAAEAYLAAAREEFWLEAARLARRRLRPAPDRGAAGAGQASQLTAEPGPAAAEAQARTKTRTAPKPRAPACRRTSPTRPQG